MDIDLNKFRLTLEPFRKFLAYKLYNGSHIYKRHLIKGKKWKVDYLHS